MLTRIPPNFSLNFYDFYIILYVFLKFGHISGIERIENSKKRSIRPMGRI
jgi:hypothetical protein